MESNGSPANGLSDHESIPSTGPRSKSAKGDEAVSNSARTRAAERDYRPDYEEPSRKPASDRENSFNSLAWLLEGATGLFEELRHNDLGLPEEFWVHAYAARRESLLALRAVLDDMIEKSSQEAKRQEDRQKRRERRGSINID